MCSSLWPSLIRKVVLIRDIISQLLPPEPAGPVRGTGASLSLARPAAPGGGDSPSRGSSTGTCHALGGNPTWLFWGYTSNPCWDLSVLERERKVELWNRPNMSGEKRAISFFSPPTPLLAFYHPFTSTRLYLQALSSLSRHIWSLLNWCSEGGMALFVESLAIDSEQWWEDVNFARAALFAVLTVQSQNARLLGKMSA